MPAKELGSCGCGGGCQRPRRRRGRRRRQQPDDTVRPRGLCSGRTPQANWKSFKKWPMVEMHVKLKRQQHPNTPLSPVHHGRSWRVDTQRLLLLIVLSGCVVLGLWGSVTIKVAAKTATDAVGPHYRFLISATGRQPTMTMRRNQHIYPSVLLPKYGLVRGLRFDWSPRDPSGNHDPDTGHHHQQQQQAETVAAFLGVPYAAPPSGPLRFMPPGAARPMGQRAQNELQCSVMPTVDSSAAATISSRPFVEFGHECVQLADWLTTKSAPPPVASQDEPTDDASGTRWPPAATGQRRQAARRQEQSEDCLNLNVFVPLEPNKNNNNNNSNSNSSKPAQLRHHSNIDHQQQPAANTRPTPVAVAQRIKKNSNQLENDDDYKDESGERTNEAAPSEPHEQLVDLANQTTSQSVPRRRRRTTVAAGNNDNDSIWAQAHDQTNTRTTTATTTTILTDATNNNNQLKPICHLQPIINNDPTGEPASGIGVGRDDKPQPSMRAHQQSANRRRLPVIVVFHSSSKLSEAGRVDSGAGQNGPPAQEPESASAPVPQFQSGNAGDSSAPTMARDDGRLAANSETETGSGGGISVIANNSRNSLPPPPSKDNENNKANSFAHLELARRTKSIVITFNYRIGLLGYLPYVDLEDQQLGTGASGPGPFQSSHTRSNHAIWDQIGLLHWIKHNVAHFGGDQANVSLLSGDPGAVQTLQLLALSPQARGLFKRLILVHDDLSMTQQSGGSSSQLDNHFGRLFGLAQTAKHLHRKLVSELGLILERDQLLNEAGGVSGTGASANEDGPQDNFEIDRRVSRFLKSAKLDQLARAEHELAKVSVSLHQQHHHQTASRHSLTDSRDNLGSRQRSSPATTRLIDVIREPNLDDKLLFPYFAHLIKMNRSLESTADGDGSGGELGQTAGRRSPMDHSSIGFWPALAASLDEHQQQQSDNSTTPSSLQTVQLESEYCRYMQHLYAQMFSNRSDTMELDSGSLMSVLKRLDPYKLIPRVSDHQPVTMMSLVSPSSLASSLTTRLDGSNGQGAGDRGQAAARSPNQQLSSKHFIKWKQRNRTANALEFYHLRHAHLLQQILVQNLDKIKNSSATNSNILVRYGGNRTISPLDELKHRNDIDEHGGSDDRVETDREEAYEEADEEEEEDEDEEDGQLLTRLQRQQQRSIMMMQQQQLGQESAGYSRNKRNSLTDVHAAGLSQQLVELLGSFDLLIAFRGEPLVDSGHFASWPGGLSVPYPSPSTLPDEPSLALVSLGSRFTLSEPLVSYLQMADLHHLAATRSAPRHLNNLCEFTGYHQRQSSGAASGWLREPRLEGPRSSYVMVTDWRRRRRGSIRQRRPSSSSGWPTAHQHIQSKDQQQQQQKQQHTAPNDEEPLIGKIAEFAATGKLSGANQNQNQNLEDSKNERSAELVRPYDTLNRELVLIAGDTTTVRAGSSNSYNEQALIRNLIRVRLDLVPYLKRLLEVTNSRRATSGQNLATKHDHHHEHLLEHPLMPPVDLISCVSELNSILNQSTWDKLDDESGGHRHQKLHLMFDNSSLVRFEEEAPCLLNATNKLRLQLRAGAAEELDPLIRQYFIMIEQRQKKQQLNMTNTNKSADSNNQATLALNNEKQLTHHGQRVSSMTTRNLVNQSEGLYLDQLSSSSASSSAALDQLGHHLEREQATSSDGANNGADQRLFAPFGPDNAQATTSTSLPASSNGGGGIRGFFAKTYKDAVGQALGIVVGTGLLIFLLNLAIVLVIAFRSRRNLRRGGEGTNLSTGSCSITNRQSVRDSSSASSNPMPLTIDEDDLEHGLKTMDSTMNGAELGVGACNQQKHFYNQTSLEMNGCSMDMMRPHVGASGGGEGGRHLVSSFETNNFDQIEQEQQQLQQLQSIQTRSSLSSNSQRANKSIKFDLSGAHDKSLSKTSLGGGGHCQRGIMKQPVNTSDEDELQMIETQIGCAHQHNNHQHHHHHHELDNNQISRIEHVTDRYSQQQQLTAVSPVSLDVLDLIPLDGLGYYADAQELAELASSGDDLAVGSQKLVAHSTGARSCQLQAYSNHRHDHHNHHHHHHQQQQQHPIHTQSLGSSSLTSPFASQSTHSTISASNNGHTQNNMNNLNGRGEFSPKRNRMQQQQQHLTFYTGLGIGTLNSPTSSTTLSSAPTPILLTHQHYGAQKPVLIASSRDQTGSLYQQFDQEEPRPQTNNQVISLIYNGGDGIMGAQRGRVMLHDQDKIALEQQQQQQQWQHLEN